jgi:Fur family transcriptional regulator, zinc uptake regulator
MPQRDLKSTSPAGPMENLGAGTPRTCQHVETIATRKVSKAQLKRAINEAQRRCVVAGLRWTPVRERALTLILGSDGPVKAYDLMAAFKEGAETAPPTVYRALDALIELGLVHRIASMNAFVACDRRAEHHAATFLICDRCGSVEETAGPSEDMLRAAQSQSAFQMKSLTLEAHGYCPACQLLATSRGLTSKKR